MTWQLHHKSGQKLFLEVKAAPVRNAHGSIIGAVETFTDAYPDAVAEQGRPEAWSAPGCVDPLTGITGHALMQCHLREALGTFAEMQVPFGVLRVRPEGLEQLRAKCGQEAASGLLRAIAQTIERALWGTDFVGRWNDDEFLVILNGCGEEALHAVRERIQRIASGAAIQWWGETRSLPLSFGEACVRRDDTAEILLERAGRSLIRDAARADIGAGAPHS
jgi:diguanylate cyclase (GGDEF)-like protein